MPVHAGARTEILKYPKDSFIDSREAAATLTQRARSKPARRYASSAHGHCSPSPFARKTAIWPRVNGASGQ